MEIIHKNKKEHYMKNFKHLYPVSKTLRFELKPEGKTMEFLNEQELLENDRVRSESYKEVKKIMDKYHAYFINKSLIDFNFKDDDLDDYQRLFYKTRSDTENKEMDAIKKEMRTSMVKSGFKKDKDTFDKLFKKDVITLLIDFINNGTQSHDEKKVALEHIEMFQKFSTYFTGFFTNRKNVYSNEDKHSSIAYRTIHENLPLFLSNLKIYERVKEFDPSLFDAFNADEFKLIQDRVNQDFVHMNVTCIADIFSIKFFNRLLTQKGIDYFNSILGGFTDGQKEKSVEGLNQKLNQSKAIEKLQFKPLKKQILGESIRLSKPIEVFETDQDVIQAIHRYYKESTSSVTNLAKLWNDLMNGSVDYSEVYLSNNQTLTALSNRWLGDWDQIKECIIASKTNSAVLTNAKRDKQHAAYNKQKSIRWHDIQDSVNQRYEDKHLIDYFKQLNVSDTFKSFNVAYKDFEDAIHGLKDQSLKTNKKAKSSIQSFLDIGVSLYKIMELFKGNGDEVDRDIQFYSILEKEMNVLESILFSVYNKARNYLTKKPYSLEKFKLNFETATLLNGWSQSKEKENLGVILQKNDQFYLAILNTKYRKVFDKVPEPSNDDMYKKMNYKFLGKPTTMCLKNFLPTKNIKKFNPSDEVLQIRKRGSYLKGEHFKLEDCHTLIDFFKASIPKYSNWKCFDFKFSDTSSYKDISDFYREVEQSGYKVEFTNLPADYVDNLVNEGHLYLFHIYNKDFSANTKGRPNLHTMYWRALFEEKNLTKPNIKLNGEAEVFFRKKSINDSHITHPKGDEVKNKQSSKVKVFDYDLIKDKRFRKDKFQFHVNITLNHGARQISPKQINLKVRDELVNNNDMKIIGIDRGEHHLLYYSLIDQNGTLLKQASLNSITQKGHQGAKSTNYANLLEKKEIERRDSRRNWDAIHNIKELKSGYLSQAIHEITQLMVKENAIVVLENLNMGFKSGRSKVEKQVYQKFEKMLIDKLNFLVDKTKSGDEDGSVYHAHQLSTKFESFEKMGFQNGCLFYVEPSYTSVIDPMTGFAPVYKFKRSEKVDNIKEALKHITNFNFKSDQFKFDMDFTQLKPNFPYTFHFIVDDKARHVFNMKSKRDKKLPLYKELNLKEELVQLFEEFDILYLDGKDVSNQIQQVKQRNFFERLTFILNTLFKLRYSYKDENGHHDYILSPTPNESGVCFNSQDAHEGYPTDGDANGAYHIALKGLSLVKEIQSNIEKPKLVVKQDEWFKFAREMAKNKNG
jgi:CRISPR-associated protein Cpf1